MHAPPLLQVRNVTKTFPGVIALDAVDLTVEAGKVHAVMGENGAGKSTLMNILAGLHQPDSGEILLDGETARFKHPHDARRRGIAMIHQELLPFPDLTIYENICIGREPVRGFWRRIDRAAMRRQTTTLLSRLGIDIPADRKMRELNVAAMQTIEIAKALAQRARVLIMDEPTSAISGREVEALFAIIRELTAEGVAVIYISHKMDEIFRIADTISVMRDGRHVATLPAREVDESRLVTLMVGRELATGSRRHASRGEPILEVRSLAKPGSFHDISFRLHRGEILGIAGLMGAGRTELLAALSGLAPSDSGEVFVRGQATPLRSPSHALAAGIALVSEDRRRFGFVPRMSIQQNIALARPGSWLIDRKAEAATAARMMQSLSIKASGPDQRVADLSGGNQQKVVIARALQTNPDILLLDEPTRGIDVGAKAEVHSLIGTLASEGKAILVVSSELPELLSLSDRLLVMREGTFTAELDPRSTNQEAILRFAMPS